MAVTLFSHNEKAYRNALKMLSEKGKAAIVHPTGTGKSFIGFKLCEEHPDKTVCWLSPSEYIFKTQLENLSAVSDGYQPQNVKFFTYARLMNLSDEEMKAVQPDYIVLDEFHRCGAQEWGKGVRNFLKIYDSRPILGLSATNVRYLDNQRDMADELFDGNVASFMTLGDAIVRGILNAPKYVLSVFSCRKSLLKYEERVKRTKSKATRDAAEEYLEKLRRALDKAEGLNEVFARHMPGKNGKYIVFCSDFEHLCEMTEKVPEWFGKVDDNPHVYKAYSEDPYTDKAFADFKQDDSEHLKLLFCIDMLNEGVHVDDVNGVILLRPTVSPIIYKQQIGRALSASKKTEPVIFDIVLNIENLYSIGSIQEEMQAAVAYYRSLGENDKIAVETFHILDEVKECRLLFQRLNDTLSASWDCMYDVAKEYYETHGNLEVEKRYVTEEGYSLGSWLTTQRLVYNGKANGILTDEQIEKLNAIGMRWERAKDAVWKKNFRAAKEYYEEHGDLFVSLTDKEYHGVDLGKWLAQIRGYRKSGICTAYLTDERIQLLDEIGMVWDVPDYLFEKNFTAALEYYRKNGNLDVPVYYVTEDGIRLGQWFANLRSRLKGTNKGAEITAEQKRRLDELGFVWEGRHNQSWENAYREACAYKKKFGNLNVPVAYVTETGLALGKWIRRQIDGVEKLSSAKKEKLTALGLSLEKPDAWEEKFALLKAYYEEHGNLKIPANYVVNGVWIARWLSEQKARLNGKSVGRNGRVKTLTKEQEKKLLSLGLQKNVPQNEVIWKEQYEEAKKIYEINGNLSVPKTYLSENGKSIGRWIIAQRKYRKQGALSEEKIALLDAIGMVWSYDDAWETGFSYAEEYFRYYGNLLVKTDYVTSDGFRLGIWIKNQRVAYKCASRKNLTEEQKKRLDSIGFIADVYEYKWNFAYERVLAYFNVHNNVVFPRGYTVDGVDLQSWLAEQRQARKNRKLSETQIKKLDVFDTGKTRKRVQTSTSQRKKVVL